MFEIDAEVTLVVRQWVQKAENDLKTAVQTLKLGARSPTDTICFHAQQCVEKYLKALLTLRGIEFARVHHLNALIDLLPIRVRPDLATEEQERLTEYAVATRYPGDYERIPLDEAREAVRIARRVRKQIRQWLPKESLRPL
jgi:HEPN domain-containing protein